MVGVLQGSSGKLINKRGREQAGNPQRVLLCEHEPPHTVGHTGKQCALALGITQAVGGELFGLRQFLLKIGQKARQGMSAFGKAPSQQTNAERVTVHPSAEGGGIAQQNLAFAPFGQQGMKQIFTAVLIQPLDRDDALCAPIGRRQLARGHQHRTLPFLQFANKGGQVLGVAVTLAQGINQRFEVVEQQQAAGVAAALQNGLLQDRFLGIGRRV